MLGAKSEQRTIRQGCHLLLGNTMCHLDPSFLSALGAWWSRHNKNISIQSMPCRWWHAIQKVCLGSFELRMSQNLSFKNSFERSAALWVSEYCSCFPKDGRSFLSIYDGTTRYKLGLTTYDRSGGMAKNWKRCPGQHCRGFPNDSNGCGKNFTSFAGFFVHSSEEQASRSMQGFPRHSAAWAVPGTPRCSQQRIRRVTTWLCQGPELSSWYVRSYWGRWMDDQVTKSCRCKVWTLIFLLSLVEVGNLKESSRTCSLPSLINSGDALGCGIRCGGKNVPKENCKISI